MNDPKSLKDSYKNEENNLSQKTSAFLNMLTNRGIIEDQQIDNEKIRQAEKNKRRNMYHNTLSLLQNYRSIGSIFRQDIITGCARKQLTCSLFDFGPHRRQSSIPGLKF